LALLEKGVSPKRQFWRRNDAFLRQGEWFFVPEPSIQVDDELILRHEPIQRGVGKPHYVDELFRTGGAVVYVCSRHPNGLRPEAYHRLIRLDPQAAGWGWRLRKRDPRVYARGMVRHPDHATIVLPGWHRVYPNTEDKSIGRQFMAFID
jgi:hypothetical protein